jgi:RNA-directed DNA polymerase
MYSRAQGEWGETPRSYVTIVDVRAQAVAGTTITALEAGRVAIRRFVKIRSEANPYDPKWELYLEERLYWKLEGTLAGRGRIEYLWRRQEGRCARCGQTLRPNEKPWHIHHRRWLCHGGEDTVDNVELLHKHCHYQIHYGEQH